MWNIFNMPHEIEEAETSLIEFYEFEDKNTISTTKNILIEIQEEEEKKQREEANKKIEELFHIAYNNCISEKRKDYLNLLFNYECSQGCKDKTKLNLVHTSSLKCPCCCITYITNSYYDFNNKTDINDEYYNVFDQSLANKKRQMCEKCYCERAEMTQSCNIECFQCFNRKR